MRSGESSVFDIEVPGMWVSRDTKLGEGIIPDSASSQVLRKCPGLRRSVLMS